jgi:hypothetical protein
MAATAGGWSPISALGPWKALLRGGVLADPLYAQALARFGRAGTSELIYLVGHYCFVSMTLNGFGIPVP